MDQMRMEEDQIDHTHDQEVLKEIFQKKSQEPRKSWFGQESEKKILEKRLSLLNLDSAMEKEECEIKTKKKI
jgi:hypothetical protein